MRKSIHILNTEISNQIAAGEVVERPAAVVKELIENSMDAGAKNITIDIEKAGKKQIRITDDGCGIPANEVLMAFDRHSTSKIYSIDDIYNIHTLGFRGEALASISAVSNIEILTRTKYDDIGYNLKLSASKVLFEGEVGCPLGTTIIIKDLFFNTPARLKFLKSDNVEATAIHDIINKLALSNPDISFRYTYNNKHMFTTSGDGDLFKVIHCIYQRDMSEHLVKINYKEQNIDISGYISHVEYSRGNRSLQIFFVNGRYVKSNILIDALALAYKPMLFPGRFPVCFLMIDIPFNTVDVNIHPAKTEIKFHEEGRIKQTIYSGVRGALLSVNQVPRVSAKMHSNVKKDNVLDNKNFTLEENINNDTEIDIKKIKKDNNSNKYINNDFNTKINKKYDKQNNDINLENNIDNNNCLIKEKILNNNEDYVKNLNQLDKKESKEEIGLHNKIMLDNSNLNSNNLNSNITKYDYNMQNIVKPNTNKSNISYEQMSLINKKLEHKADVYNDLKYLGTLFTTYLLFEKADRLYLMDQHAAHEKVKYEEFLSLYLKGQINRQILLTPIVINLSYGDYETVKSNISFYESLGLLVEDFGKNSIVIREIPSIFNENAAKILFEKAVSQIAVGESVQTFVQSQLDNIAQKACKSAIKAHDSIDKIEIYALIDSLKKLNDPYTCPHGRPIMISITENEIERKFKRRV